MNKGRMRKGVIRIKLPRGMSLDDEVLVEKILDSLKSRFAAIRYEKGYLRVEYYTQDYMKKDVERSIQNILKDFYSSKESIENVLHTININDIARMGRRTLPLDIIVFILTYRGYTAKRVKGGLETDAPREIASEIISSLSSIVRSVDEMDIKASRNLRNILISMKYLEPEKDIYLILEELKSKGYLVNRDDYLDLNTSWKNVLCKLYLTSNIGSKIMRVCSKWRK